MRNVLIRTNNRKYDVICTNIEEQLLKKYKLKVTRISIAALILRNKDVR